MAHITYFKYIYFLNTPPPPPPKKKEKKKKKKIETK